MNYYLITLRDRDENVVEEFVQGARCLGLALEVSAARIRGTRAGHGQAAASSTVALMERCRCGQFEIDEYGPECPSCKVDQEAVRRLAEDNPRHAIEGWLAGYQANGDAANAAECEAALDLQARWHFARLAEHRVSYFSEVSVSRAVCSCGRWAESHTDENALSNLFDEHLGDVAAGARVLS